MNTNACPKFASLYFEYSVSTKLKLISICVLAGVFHPISLLLSKCIKTTVLKTGPDRPVRPVQPGTGSQSGPVNTPKTGQQPVKNRKTGQKPEKNRG